ncbi:hypothetical protein FQV37_1444 [Psychrobacter nivimaris]|uniref:Uncharacterized protein n=1 Tax=Psychrobacter nivimaris TaxID=281738 RepID=A0A6N7BYA2_9GAMM|nr:hypothetical protein FQV37_1444 [Psychrobacter nivimaris]
MHVVYDRLTIQALCIEPNLSVQYVITKTAFDKKFLLVDR